MEYDLIHTHNPLVNIVSFLTTTIMAGQVLRTLTLQASALSNPLINSIGVENQPDKKEID